MNTAAGIAVTGAQIFNGLSADNRDAVEFEKMTLDACLTHPTPFGLYHYHSWSPCILKRYKQTSKTRSPGTCRGDRSCWRNPIQYNEDGWTSTRNFGGMVGMAKDGHPIYGPYNEYGELWLCSEHDICNGRFFKNGSYGYVSTNTHPYMVGCWGPAAYQKHDHTCSSYACPSGSHVRSGSRKKATRRKKNSKSGFKDRAGKFVSNRDDTYGGRGPWGPR